MIIAFIIWSIIAIGFIAIGFSCYKSDVAVGFFTFTKAPEVKNIEDYNHAVGKLWFFAALVYELIGIPFLFLEQNSPVFILIMFAIFLWLIFLMIGYFKIESRYRK